MGFKEAIEKAEVPVQFEIKVSPGIIKFYYLGYNYYDVLYEPEAEETTDKKTRDKLVHFDGTLLKGLVVTSDDKVKFKMRFSDIFKEKKGSIKVQPGLLYSTLDAAIVKTIDLIKSKNYSPSKYNELKELVSTAGDPHLMKLHFLRK